jgi:enoyl-CoA hydratase
MKPIHDLAAPDLRNFAADQVALRAVSGRELQPPESTGQPRIATMTAWTCFDVETADKIAHIRLKRGAALNSMTRAFWRELPEIVRDIDRDARARVLVISSTGKHFSAGMDLSVFTGDDGVTRAAEPADRFTAAEAFRRHVKELQESFSCLDEARAPVLVAMQGGVIGAGVDMISACDIRYCTKDAFLCIQEINLAMTADVGTFPRLCHLMPQGALRELAYTGRRLGAERALALGLVSEIYEDQAAMLKAVFEIAREIAAKSPLAIAGSKHMMNRARDHTIADCLDYIATWQAGMFAPAHMGEAFAAKAQEREPVFPDLEAKTGA